MVYYRKLVGEKCYLSPCSSTDAEAWARWDNDLEVGIPLGDEAYTLYPLEKMEEIVDGAVKSQSPIFSILDMETDKLIGRCLLFNMNQVDRHAWLGIVIGEKDYWGRGYGQDALKLLLDFAFNLLNLNSVMLGTFAFNQRAIAAYRKVGFKEIGRRRQARIIAGKKYDAILMDILAEDYQSVYVKRLVEEVSK